MKIRSLAVLLSILLVHAARGGIPVPIVGDKPVDPGKLRVDNPAVISTDGTWRFKLTHGRMADGGIFKPGADWATASSSQLPAENAVDGKEQTRWCADGADMPQWWQADLGKPLHVAMVGLSWEFGDGSYHYRVDLSTDGKNWTNHADQTGGDGAVKIADDGVLARFVRVTVLSAHDKSGEPRWASIREATITVFEDGLHVRWQPAAGTVPQSDDFAAVDYDDKSWNDIPVPSNWEVLGYSKPTYFGPDDAVGLYRKTIDIPADWAGKKIFWHCDGCTDSAEVFVNGKKAGYHESGYTAFDIDLTPAIEPGKKNLIAIRVCKRTPSYDLDTGDYWFLGGIHRESHLLAVPEDHIEDATITTKLTDGYQNATLSGHYILQGTPGHSVTVTCQLLNVDGTPWQVPIHDHTDVAVVTPAISGHAAIGDDGKASLDLSQQVLAPALWSAEKPNLYYLLITLKSGDTTETVEQRFGFRQTEIKDGVLLFNGQPIKCCGTCRHEEWSALGHALTEHEWQTDIDMMKAANINAVRTSHYNHAERFLELCDEKGLYVLDEIPACWVSNKDPALKDAFVLHAKETLARDKNKPCVLAWSCGNESGWGPNFKAMVDYVAATDPTRPRFVSQVHKSQDPLLSFDDYHYPGDNDLRKICTTPGPSVITEGPHIFYNIAHQRYDYGLNDLWGEALANQWDRVWPSQYLFGAFVWEWQDQGLADKYPDHGRDNPYKLRQENSKGIVTGYREPKPEWYHVKMVYSPVVTDQREVRATATQWLATVRNRYSFTDLSELKCRWQAMSTIDGDRILAEADFPCPCPPGQSAEVAAPVTAAADTLRLSFTNPSGVEVYAVRLHVPGMPLPAPPAAAKITTVVRPENAGQGWRAIAVADPSKLLVLPADEGGFELFRGDFNFRMMPDLNLGEARVDDGDFANKNEPRWIGSKHPPVLKLVSHADGPTADHGWQNTAVSDVSLVEAPNRILGRLTCDFLVHGDGNIDCNYSLKWTAEDMQAWEFGLKFPGMQCDRFSWTRHGLWTEYPAGHIGADHGSVDTTDRSAASTKRNIIWAAVSGPTGGVELLPGDGPLHVRCNSVEDKIHPRTDLLASSAVSVDRDFSSGYVDYTRITFKTGHTYGGSFHLRLTDGQPARNPRPAEK